MFKFILEANDIDYDAFLEQLLNYAKEHPEQLGGAKLPPFSAKMLKMVPKKQKNALFAKSLGENKAQFLPQLEMMLGRFLGPVHVQDAVLNCDTPNGSALEAIVEVSDLNNYYFLDNVMPGYYSDMNASEMMGAGYMGGYDLQSVSSYIKQQDSKTQRILIAKSIKANKMQIMRNIENAAAGSGIQLDLSNIRIMVK